MISLFRKIPIMILISLLLTGCFPLCTPHTTHVRPQILPTAIVHQPYTAQLIIYNRFNELSIITETFPGQLQLNILKSTPADTGRGQKISISGTPTQAGLYPIQINMLIYGTMCVGKSLTKSYVIEVVEPLNPKVLPAH